MVYPQRRTQIEKVPIILNFLKSEISTVVLDSTTQETPGK